MSTKQDHLSIEEEAWAFDKEVHAMKEEFVVGAGYINPVAQALEDLLLLLSHPSCHRDSCNPGGSHVG